MALDAEGKRRRLARAVTDALLILQAEFLPRHVQVSPRHQPSERHLEEEGEGGEEMLYS